MKSPTDKDRWRVPGRLWRETEGVVSIEVAVVVLVLVPLVMGAVDFGMGFREKLRLTNAARAGAQYAITNPNLQDVPGTIQAARNDANDTTNALAITAVYSSTCPDGTSLPCAANVVPYDFITVTVGATYNALFSYPGLPTSIPLQKTAILRIR